METIKVDAVLDGQNLNGSFGGLFQRLALVYLISYKSLEGVIICV